jgi:PAS domain S-box-containing protein
MTSPSRALSPEYSRFRQRLVLGLLAVACLVIIAVTWKVYSSFRQRETGARIETETCAHAIAAHVSDAVELADYALIGFANAIKVLPTGKATSVATIQQLLSSHDSSSSKDFWMMFIDAKGVGVASSKSVAVQGVSYADRDYFQALAGSGADQGLYIGEPVIGRASKIPMVPLSRRVADAQGKFLGVIIAPVDASRLGAMFERAQLKKNISIGLVHQGGKVIARVPLFQQSFATSLHDSDLFRQMRQGPTTFQADSPFDGQPMIYSFRTLENKPLTVFVGLSVQALNQAFRKDLLIGGAAIGLMLVIMLLSAHFALGSYRRLEVSKQALQESELRWKFALEGAGSGVWDWNAVTNEVDYSLRWKQMLGYAEDEIDDTYDAWESRIHPDDKSQVKAETQACLNGDKPLYFSEYRMRCKDGSWKWILARGTVISRDADGRALRVIGTHADISSRKQAEQAQVYKIVEAAPDPMLLIGNDGKIVFANQAAQSAFGYALDELTGKSIDNLVPFNSRSSHAHLRRVKESSKNPYPWPLTAVHQDGTEFSVEISLSPFQMDGQAVVIANIRDISERKRAAELLQQSFTQLRRLSDHQEKIKEDERKRIAQDIHDDLGQNLLALKMDVAMLFARTGDAHPKLHKRVRVVLNNIDATIKSVKTIMNDLRPATLELGLYPAVEWQLKQFERRNNIVCRLVSSAPEAEFGLDEARTSAVFRILQESLANVARHAEATEVEISLRQDAYGFSMQVKDNGKGLLPSDRRKENSFGLMGIRERITSLGGEMTLASSPNQGTLLSISIPPEEKKMAEGIS